MRLLTLYLLCITCFQTAAQQYGDPAFYLIDSLDLNELEESDKLIIDQRLKAYHKAESDSIEVQELAQIVNGVYHPCWERYNHLLFQKCRQILKDTKGSENRFIRMNLAGSINNKGYAAGNRGDSYLAAEYYIQSSDIFGQIGDSAGMALGYLNVANTYKKIGEFELSNKMDEKGLEIALAIDQKCHIATGYHNLGLKLFASGRTDEAMSKYQLGLTFAQECENNMAIEAYFYSGFADIYVERGEDSLAAINFNKSLEIRKDWDDYSGIIKIMLEISEFNLYRLNKLIEKKERDPLLLDSTKKLMQDCLKLANFNSSEGGVVESYVNLSAFYRIQGKYELAEKYADSAYRHLESVEGLSYKQKAIESKYLILKIKGNYKAALEFYEQMIEIKDQLINSEAITQAAQHQYKVEYSIRAAKDSANYEAQRTIAGAELELKNNKIASDKKQKWFLYGGLMVIAVFSYFLFRKFKESQRQKNLIEDQKILVEDKNQEIMDSINYAKRIQAAILPPPKIVDQYLKENFVLYLPKDIVAGDFYWLQHVEKNVLFAAADCTGHGVPGAMVSVVCNNALNRSVKEFGLRDPGKILDKTREIVIDEFSKAEENVKDGMDIALCYLENKKVSFSGAHNPMWIVRNNEITEVKGDKQPIGNFEHQQPFKTQVVELKTGDSLYLFSDGIVDQFGGPKGKKFKPASLRKLLLELQKLPMQEQKTKIEFAFNQWRGNLEQIDDLCVIGVRI